MVQLFDFAMTDFAIFSDLVGSCPCWLKWKSFKLSGKITFSLKFCSTSGGSVIVLIH